MPKFFVMSDIHGFYDEMIEALNVAGFDKNNPEHWVITCGDHWDRGNQPFEVMDYLMCLDRWIGIVGNHEQLFNECCTRGCWYSHDVSNGTFDTICELGGAGEGRNFNECCIIAEQKAKPFFNKMVNYFETKNYVFCHSWIPVDCNDDLPYYYQRNRNFVKNENWRYAHQKEWDQAMWLKPLSMALGGFGIEKTIVSGHWHCSAGWALDDDTLDEFGEDACFEPYYYKDELIMIDGCTAYTKKVNVLVLEDEFI
jgi:hypothetical protein